MILNAIFDKTVVNLSVFKYCFSTKLMFLSYRKADTARSSIGSGGNYYNNVIERLTKLDKIRYTWRFTEIVR